MMKKKEAKRQWYEQDLIKRPYYDFNWEMYYYCRSDVRILLGSVTRFVLQAFQYGALLRERFGASPAYNPRVTLQDYHPFCFPTLGSYTNVSFPIQ